MKKWISILLAVVMVFSLFPVGVLAADGVCVAVLGTAIDAAKSSLAKRVCRDGPVFRKGELLW